MLEISPTQTFLTIIMPLRIPQSHATTAATRRKPYESRVERQAICLVAYPTSLIQWDQCDSFERRASLEIHPMMRRGSKLHSPPRYDRGGLASLRVQPVRSIQRVEG